MSSIIARIRADQIKAGHRFGGVERPVMFYLVTASYRTPGASSFWTIEHEHDGAVTRLSLKAAELVRVLM